jgi:hypothetical protein
MSSCVHWLVRHNYADADIPIRIEEVAAAIAASPSGTEPNRPVFLGQPPALLQIREELIALCVHVGGDVVSHLTCAVAESHAAVERRSAQP